MESATKFAAHERGSARTLVMVPGNRPAVANGAAGGANGLSRTTADRVVPNGAVRPTVAAGVEPVGSTPMREAGVRTITCRAGQKVFGPGSGGGAVYYLRRGCVALFKALPGRRSICVGLLGPNDVFMQEAGRDGAPVSGVTAEVLADATIVVLNVEALPRLMAASPELAATIVTGFSHRLTGVQGLVEQLLSRDITLRLASVLLVLADQFGEPDNNGMTAIGLPMPHKLLARLIGANRVTVTRVVTDFRTAGLAESRGRNQIAVDPDKLRAYMRQVSRSSSVVSR